MAPPGQHLHRYERRTSRSGEGGCGGAASAAVRAHQPAGLAFVATATAGHHVGPHHGRARHVFVGGLSAGRERASAGWRRPRAGRRRSTGESAGAIDTTAPRRPRTRGAKFGGPRLPAAAQRQRFSGCTPTAPFPGDAGPAGGGVMGSRGAAIADRCGPARGKWRDTPRTACRAAAVRRGGECVPGITRRRFLGCRCRSAG